MSELDEITHLGTRILDRILKPVYDRITEVSARVEALEREVFDRPKQTQGATSVGSFVLPVTQSASSSTPPAAPPAADVEPDRMSDPPAQVAGDLEHEHETEPVEPSAS